MVGFRPAAALAALLSLSGCMSGEPGSSPGTSSENKGQVGQYYYVNLFTPPVGGIITSSEVPTPRINCGASSLGTPAPDANGVLQYAPVHYDGANRCGTKGQTRYEWGEQVVLTAAAQGGNTFYGWAGDCSGTGPCTLSAGADKTVVAVFTSGNNWMLTVARTGTGSGSISADVPGKPTLTCGPSQAACIFPVPRTTPPTVATLTVQPDPTSNFLGWTGACAGPGACTLAVDGTTAVEAIFELGATGGTVVDAGGGVVTSPTGDVVVTVPEAAVDTPSTLSVDVAVAPPPVPTDVEPEGDIYEFKPHGKVFATPVEVSLPVNQGTLNACLYWQKPNAEEFECIGGELNNGHIKAKVSHFSAAFVGPPSPMYTVQGAQFNTHLATLATVANVPDNLTDDTIAAWIPDVQGGFTRYAGQGFTDGTFRIPNVPVGRPVLVQVGPDPTRFAFIVSTTASNIDTGRILNGLPGLTEVAATDPMPVLLDIQNLAPYQSGDQIDVTAPRMDTWFYGIEGPTFPAGSTSLTVTNLKAARSWVSPVNAIDGTRAATVVTQLSGNVSPTGWWHRRLVRFGKILGLDVGPSVPPVPVTLTLSEVAQTDGVSVDWDIPAFVAASPGLDGQPCGPGGANFQVLGQPGPLTFGASPVETKRQYLSIGFGLPPNPVSTGLMPFGGTDSAQGAWSQLWQANLNCYVPLPMPGGGAMNIAPNYVIQGIHGGPGSHVSLPGPAFSPPRDVRLNGLSMASSLFDVPEVSVVSWTPPLFGTPDLYRVLVRHHPTGTMAGAIRAIILTKDTSVTIPPGILVKGGTHTLVVNAFRGGYTLERPERLSFPSDRANQPGAWFTVASDRFRVGGTLTGIHVPGLVLSTPGQPDLAIDPKASGFSFATPVPQGTPYAVTITQLPPNQVCTVANGSGTVGAGDVSNVAVSCRTIEQVSGCGDLAEYAVPQRWSYTYTPGPAVSTRMITANTPAPYRGFRFIRAVTNAAYGFSMIHTSDVPVDASAFEELRFAVRALNPNTYGWQGSFPVVVLQDTSGNRMTFTPAANLMPTDGTTWVPITVPLRGGAGWSQAGWADLASVVRIEVYSDTWDFQPLTIDVDGMSFEHPATVCP